MKNIATYIGLASIIISAFLSVSCKKDPTQPDIITGQVTLEFDNMVGTIPLSLDNQEYTNANGDKFKVSVFKYYVSNFSLKKADGTEYKQPESYFLVDESKAASKLITIKDIPAGEYTNISFTIGVDSTRNVSGAQTGALDPANGMFWTWKSGYIFLKLEGTSLQSTNGGLVFHIGGFQKPTNTIRTVSPSLNGQKLRINAGKAPQVHLNANIANMFQGVNPIRFSELSTTMGGANSVKVADNYVNMFQVDHIHN